MNDDLTLIDSFDDQLIIKDGDTPEPIQFEIYNKVEDRSEEFFLTIEAAEKVIEKMQYMINCNKVGVEYDSERSHEG